MQLKSRNTKDCQQTTGARGEAKKDTPLQDAVSVALLAL